MKTQFYAAIIGAVFLVAAALIVTTSVEAQPSFNGTQNGLIEHACQHANVNASQCPVTTTTISGGNGGA